MVFESVVADVLNRFLGDYVENLDGSQLKLGIWGGDVVLKDLRLKDSALQDLDLPIKTVSGYLGKLVLKIPWKNLYTAPVVVLVERLHLLAVPSQGVAYNREKEDANARDLRKQQLSRYERRQQLADTSEKLKEKDDTFVEKLVTQIIKNVQVTVQDIHIRYEDQITAPDTPFALGVTLHKLCLESTDNHWKPAIVTDAVRQIYKLVSLDSLSVYWNSRTELYGQLSDQERERRFIAEIATSDSVPPGAKYILGPINAKAQLKLNPKPEHDGSGFQIPKVWLNLVLEQLAVGVTKYQYRDMMELLQSMERMTLAQPYRKYRPQVTQYHGHAAEWWRFAYKCVLNEMVRRRRRNWSWVHMKSYRDMCQRYAKAYKTKLTTKKVPADVQARIDDYEFKLDIVNVIMIRQKVQLEVDRQVERQKKEKKESGWFGGWFGGGSKTDTTADDGDIAKQFEAAMTPEERQKLYAAIDYQENAAPTEYPAEFEAVQLAFRLGTLRLAVEDEEATPTAVLRLSLRAVDASLAQRPAAGAVRVETSISELRVDGVPDGGGESPAIASTRSGSASAALLTAMFETNPLDGECDQRLRMRSQPVEMVYHAETLGRLAAVFRPPRHVQLSQLHAAAMSKLQELKETSALKMQYAIETHKSLDLEIDLMASQLVVPEFGDITKEGRRLAVNLGSVRLRSAPRQVDPVSVRKMASQGTSSEDIFTTMAAQAYDQFDIDLEDIEVVMSVPGESWREALKLSGSPQHLVRPISLSVCVKKCLITDDPRLPVVKVDAAISKLSFSISDYRLIQLAILGNSIPSPTADDDDPLALPELDSNANVLTLDRSAPVPLQPSSSSEKRQRDAEQMTDLLLNFRILELCADVYRRQSADDQSMADEMISLTIGGVGCSVAVRTNTMEVTATLAGVTLKNHEFQDPDGGQLYLVSTPMTQGRSEPLLSCKYTKVDRAWDKFHSEYGGVAQLVELSFSELTVQLHQAALCSLMAFGDALSRQLSSIGPEQPAATPAVTATTALTESTTGKRAAAARRHGSTSSDDIDIRLDACFSDFRVQLSSSRVWVAGLDMANLQLGAELRPGRTQLSASLRQFAVTDLTPNIKRDKVLSMTSDEVFRAELQLYNRPPEPEPSFVDLELSAQLGGARLLFTNRFITDVLAFMQPFSATQAALAEASQTAAEAAQQAMQNAYAQAFKAKLDITMKAPVIVVPQNSSSDWALVADLGYLSVSNSLEMPGPRSHLGAPAVLDVMTLKLDNLQFSRGRLGQDGSVQSECLILKPVTMSVQVTRNLSTGWFRERPEIDLLAKLGDLAVVLSEEDYAQIMRTLAENLSEPGTAGLDALPPIEGGETQKTATQVETAAEVDPSAAPASSAATAEKDKAPAGQGGAVFTKLKFSFDWTFVGVELFVSSAAEKSMDECKNSRFSLGTFGLHQLSVAGKMESDGALGCRVSLDDCVLQDTRADTKTCFPRLMEKVTRAGKPKVRMIDVQYSQKANQDRDLQARVSSVSLILFLPYLMMLMEFFTKNMPEPQQQDKRHAGPPAVAAKPATGKPQRPTTLEAPRKPTPASTGDSTAAGAAAAGMLTLQLTVDRPDIALVEDLTDINTRAVVFDNEIRLKVQQTPDKTNVMGDINRIQLFTCVYNPAEREATMNETDSL
ncbi:vacuolar protein sorting-associated protein 13-like [Amphibalanus amphitrite]|uniref:vacuolar protein sorting-associated protein 13-like n=1 Tax=Amphibalanus amphitrite TaxID=1232801 RepID=UPI001C927891|nr:vacuolar protein sorting-associated protein 13-like [Amphibalanus amphitrite]